MAPEVLRHGSLAGTTATVYWTAPLTGAPPTSYEVAAIPHDGNPATTTPDTSVTVPAGDRTTTTTLTGLTAGVTYDITVTALAAGGSATAVANPTTWLPSPTDGLALWLDVSHPDTVTVDAGQVTSLVDRSPAGNDPSLITQPWSASGGFRGRAVTWGFPGLANTGSAAGSMQVPHHASLDHQGAYTVLMALHQTAAAFPIYAQFLFKANYLPQFGDCYPTQYQLAKFNDPAELYGYHGSNGNSCSSFSRQGRDGITTAGDQVIGRRVRFDATTSFSHSEFRRAGNWDASASIAGRTPNTNAVLTMSTPRMSETLLFTTALADATVSAIEAYLGAKAPLAAPTVAAVTPRADGFDLSLVPGHGAGVLAAGRYQVSLDGGATWTERADGYADSPLRVSGLAPGANVTVSVRAVNAAGYGMPSPPVIVAVPVPPVVVLPPPVTQSATPSSTTSTTLAPAATPLTQERLATLPTANLLMPGHDVLQPGDTITLHDNRFTPGEVVQAVMASSIQVLNTGVADANGDVTVSATVPLDVAAGVHTLALYEPATGRGLRQAVNVVTSPGPPVTTMTPATPPSGELPATGIQGLGLAGATLVLVGLGLALALGARRRGDLSSPHRRPAT